MRFDAVGAVARRLAPTIHAAPPRRRPDDALPFDAEAAPALPLLLDTIVYLDRSAEKLPRSIRSLIAARQHVVFHCGVVCAELAISLGLLNPSDGRTAGTADAIRAHLEQMDRTVEPSAAAWVEAAILAGVVARSRGLAVPKRRLSPDQACCQEGRRRELLLDALLYVTAIEQDMLLISANVGDMDLLTQLRPSANLLLYRPI